MLMRVAHLLGMKENKESCQHDELLLRILTPLLKLYTGKQVCSLCVNNFNTVYNPSCEFLLRILTPLLKLYTGKQVCSLCVNNFNSVQ